MSIWDEYEPFTREDLRDIENKAQRQANTASDLTIWRIYMDMAYAANMLKIILDRKVV